MILTSSNLTEEDYQEIQKRITDDEELIVCLHLRTYDRLTQILLKELMRLKGMRLPVSDNEIA